MKVRDLIENINLYRKNYPDIDDWDVYTEQPELIAPLDNVSFEEYLKTNNSNKNKKEYIQIQKCYDKIQKLEKAGWKFVYDSEGWVYRDIADTGNHTLFTKEKIFTINNNF